MSTSLSVSPLSVCREDAGDYEGESAVLSSGSHRADNRYELRLCRSRQASSTYDP